METASLRVWYLRSEITLALAAMMCPRSHPDDLKAAAHGLHCIAHGVLIRAQVQQTAHDHISGGATARI